MRSREGEHTTNKHYITGVKHCNVTEFEEIGVTMDETTKQLISLRICPNISEELMPFYKVKNSYSNNTLRYSFSIEVIPCKVDQN